MPRYWGKNIRIDGYCVVEADRTETRWAKWEAEQWEVDVQNVFRKIEKSRIGKKLIGLINEISGRYIEVLPIRSQNKQQTRAKPFDWTYALKDGHETTGADGERWSSAPRPGTTDMPTHSNLMVVGNGLGSNVTLYYHPGAWNSSRQMRAVDEACGFDTSRYGYGADDVLFHECVHAWRAMKGVFEVVATGDTWRASEEFFAVVLSNIYVSETRPGDPLRGDNLERFSTLKEAGRQEGDAAFAMQYSAYFTQMKREMSELIEPLLATKAGERIGIWNPFRAEHEQQEKQLKANTVLLPGELL